MFNRENIFIKFILLSVVLALFSTMTLSASDSDGVIGTFYLTYKKPKIIFQDDMYGEKSLTVTSRANNPSDSKIELRVYRSGGQNYDKPCPVLSPGESAPVNGDVRKIVAVEIGHNGASKPVVDVSRN